MRTTYLILARTITVLVVIQAMTIAFAFSGLLNWIREKGGSLDAGVYNGWDDAPPSFTGSLGYYVHLLSGERIMPVLALVLLIVSFFAKVDKGVPIAVALFVLMVLQTVTGIFSVGAPYLGLWHGLGAFLIFGAAMAGALKAKDKPAVSAP